MSTKNINALSAASIPVFNAQVPQEGPKCIGLLLDFSAATSYVFEGKPITDYGYLSLVQSIFIDSTGCTANIVVNISGTNQNIIVKPNTQGYYPVLVPNAWRITFSCATGPAGISIFLCNMPIAPGQWATA